MVELQRIGVSHPDAAAPTSNPKPIQENRHHCMGINQMVSKAKFEKGHQNGSCLHREATGAGLPTF